MSGRDLIIVARPNRCDHDARAGAGQTRGTAAMAARGVPFTASPSQNRRGRLDSHVRSVVAADAATREEQP